MKTVNIYGGPCSGKSTSASGLFHYMKTQNYNVELVTEVAKDYVWSEHFKMLEQYQLDIFAQQNHRLERLRGKVDWAITDSPLLLSHIYSPPGYYQTFYSLVDEVFDSYDNINVILQRDFSSYDDSGRVHTQEQSEQITKQIEDILAARHYSYHIVSIDHGSLVDKLLDIINSYK